MPIARRTRKTQTPAERQAKAVALYTGEKLPTTEIARRLGCTKQAVLKMLMRAGVERRPCSWRAEPKVRDPKATMARLRARKRAAGLCYKSGCSNPIAPELGACPACRAARQVYDREYRLEKKRNPNA